MSQDVSRRLGGLWATGAVRGSERDGSPDLVAVGSVRPVRLPRRATMICEPIARMNRMPMTGPMTGTAAEPADACDWFARCYGHEPEGAWFAPGRVNLIGGPDYNEVLVF